MTDNERTQYFLVVVPVGDECYSSRHRLNPCQDCETVAAQAVVDAIDPDTAIRAFRLWEPEP